MDHKLTKTMIKQLCGDTSYKRGVAYFRAGKINLQSYNTQNHHYEALVRGTTDFHVTVKYEGNGSINAVCTCPTLGSFTKHCQHIAAVLLSICELEQQGRSPISSPMDDHPPSRNTEIEKKDTQLVNDFLKLFGNQPINPIRNQLTIDHRKIINVEFTCSAQHIGNEKLMFAVEVKLGSNHLYPAENVRELLDSINSRTPYVVSKQFTYDPLIHSFQKESNEVILQLIQIHQFELIYPEAISIDTLEDPHNSQQMMLIPPPFWERIFPALSHAPLAKFAQGDQLYDGIDVLKEQLPLEFLFDEAASTTYLLEVKGLKEITTMEAYGCIISKGKIKKLETNDINRLRELKQLLAASGKDQFLIPHDQMETFVEQVIPGLLKLGSVRIAPSVSTRLSKTPLKAKLYLDRVKDRLLAGLEFHYGNLVINPLEDKAKPRPGPILIRDGEQEQQIIELMEHSSFVKTEGGYLMHNEALEYQFLYHIVPKLKKLTEIYATTAVRARLFKENPSPKIRIKFGERIDWLEFKFEMQGIPEADIKKILLSLEEKRKYYRMANGSLLTLESREFKEINRYMNELAIGKQEIKGDVIKRPLIRGLGMIDSLDTGDVFLIDSSFRQLLENLRNPTQLEFAIPEGLNSVLRDYQKHGYQWLKTLAHYHFGGILADDMGLGKTLQSITFIVSNVTEIRDQKRPALIVCPSSLVYNWLNELKKFSPDIRTVIVDGSKMKRSLILQDISEVDVIITSYPLLRRDVKCFAEHTFHTLILDEAQAFKNYATQTAKAVKRIQAIYRFALTGTPIENSIEELWSIFNVVFPNLLPNRKAFHDLTRETVAKKVRPFILRRLKEEVLQELPGKIETTHTSELLPIQKKLYAAYLAKLRQETLKHLNKDTFRKNKIKILAGLTRLRQLCCHPALFVDGYQGSSAKYEQLMEIVEECRGSGKRMLLFSQFTKMLDIIGRDLAHQGVNYLYLDGNTPSFERVELCNRFNEGEGELFLISLKAGGTGLNLTGAETVILYDLWWNPAVEQQAADRAYRIGQKKVVQVIRLVAQGTIEDKMHELQMKKKNLIEELIEPGQERLSALTEQDIREILMIQ